jgi:nitroimidazol reductase NimA-like FMN-containing flavoprotein (pyridoxamine 5'-phosphate oxidase superfamily)
MEKEFRKMRRSGQQLSEEECIQILEEEPRGVLSVHGENGYPYGIPINFVYDGGKIYFHGARSGHKIDALHADNHVSFCVYDKGRQVEGKRGLNVRSVIVFGWIAFVDDETVKEEKLRILGLKYAPEDYVEQEVQRQKKTVQILELSIDSITGKIVNES